MSAAQPQPKPTESDVDRVIEKIDAALPKIERRAADSKRAGKSPSAAFSPAAFLRAQEEFAAMSEDNLLTKSGEDIRMDEEQTKPQPLKINGTKAHAKAKLTLKRHPA